MKKLFLFPVMLLFALTITACSNSPNGFEEPETEQPKTPENDGEEDNKPEDNSMKIKITVGNREVTATMKDNVTARDFLSRLPIEVTMNDYAGAEKIFYPEPAFNTEGAPKGHTPSRGDIDLYAPWGNVALFYKSGSHSSELIHLGRIDGNGIEAFDVTGNVVVKIERQ